MPEDEDGREGSKRSGRRDPARATRRDPPVIDAQAEDVTPPVEAMSASGDMMEAPPVEAEHHQAAEAHAEPEPLPLSPTNPTDHHTADIGAGRSETSPQGAAAAEAPSSQTDTPSSRFPWATLAALGFIALAAGLLYALSQLSSLPPDNAAAVSDLKARLTAMESRPATDASGIGDRITKLERAVGDTQTGLADLGKRVDGLAATLSAQPNVTKDMADLQGTVTALKTDVSDVKASVAALPRPDIGRLDARIGDLDQKLAGLQGAVSGIPHVDLGPLTGKVDALEARLKPIEAESNNAASPERVAQRRAAPLAVTAQAIIGAIDAGQAFPKELQALQVLGADPTRLASLQAVADAGAPSLQDLRASLADVRERIVTQGATPAAGSYVDRLVAGASSLVQVRPLGSVVGDSPSAIVARIDAALGDDRLSAALAEWQKLPEASRSASKALADRIKLRLDAELAAKDIAATAIGSMAVPRG